MRRIAIIAAALGAALVTGCTGETSRPEATGEGTVRALNAIASSPTFQVLIEERTFGTVAYKNTSNPARYDDLEYTFNFEAQLVLGESLTRVASQLIDVAADRDYTMVITGDLASPTITVWEGDVRQWTEGETGFDSRFAHLANSLGSVDVYFATEGTAPVLGEEVGTLAFGEILPPVENPEGDYVMILTTAGDPADVLFESNPITRVAQSASIVTVFDADPNDTGTLAVRAFTETGGVGILTDVNAPATLRFINASPLLGTADIFNDDPPTIALVTNHMYGDITDDIPVTAGANALTYIGATTLEQELQAPAGRHAHVFTVDLDDVTAALSVFPDRRPIETLARFNFFYAANNQVGTDLYVVEAGNGLEDQFPAAINLQVSALIERELAAGSYDLYITDGGEQTVITGPYNFDVALGGIADFIVIDNIADPATVDIVPIPVP